MFAILGFTRICGKTRSNGYYTVPRQTIRKRMQAKLSEVKDELRRRTHDPIPDVGQWFRAVVGGYIHYYRVPSNGSALGAFRLWPACSGTKRSRAVAERPVHWDRMRRLIDRRLPPVRVHHPYPLRRMGIII
jgi:RNA-directed DNA polymerase